MYQIHDLQVDYHQNEGLSIQCCKGVKGLEGHTCNVGGPPEFCIQWCLGDNFPVSEIEPGSATCKACALSPIQALLSLSFRFLITSLKRKGSEFGAEEIAQWAGVYDMYAVELCSVTSTTWPPKLCPEYPQHWAVSNSEYCQIWPKCKRKQKRILSWDWWCVKPPNIFWWSPLFGGGGYKTPVVLLTLLRSDPWPHHMQCQKSKWGLTHVLLSVLSL